jgi:tetraacyldisaccharide 4'-kinase
MREPAFWWRPGAGKLLDPLGALYGALAEQRMGTPGTAIGIPIICIGNLTVGGAGKTPAALAVGHLLLAMRERPFFLSRGYGGRLPGPVRVDPGFHHAAEVGDEPLMLARLAPTIVARDRVAGAKTARKGGASVIVMDDGFQNPSLTKNASIVVVDGTRGIGNGRILPAGPLRAPLEVQLKHAGAVVIVGPRDGAPRVGEAARRYGVAIFHARLDPDRNSLAALGNKKVLAFAGIGNPDKFFATLAEAGVAVAERISFPDHHRYTASEASMLIAHADAAGLVLMTTEKDHVRLAGDPALAKLAARANTLPVRLVIEELEQFRQMVAAVLKRRAQSG